MAVGYAVGKGDLDLALGKLATDTRDILTRGNQIATTLSGMTDTQLQNLGYSASDVTLIRNVQTDIGNLIAIIQGTGTQATTHDYMANLSQMFGTQ